MTQSIPSPFLESPSPYLRCVILDGSADKDLLTNLYQLSSQGTPTWEPLFHGTPYSDLEESGPVLVLSDQQDGWEAYSSNLLEQSDAGCVLYLEDRRDWEAAIKHCKSLLTVRVENQQQQLMRFFEPRWLEPLLASLSPTEREKFFGPFRAMAWRNELGWRYAQRSDKWDGKVQAEGWLWLGQDLQQAMEKARLRIIAKELANDYQAAIPSAEREAFVYDELLAAHAADFHQKSHYERWLRMTLSKPKGFWKEASTNAVLGRDDLAAGEKLDTLEGL